MINFTKQPGQRVLELGGGANRHPNSFRYDDATRVCYRSLSFMGYSNYQVGDDGTVLGRGRWNKGIWKKIKSVSNGRYYVITLHNDGGFKQFGVAHLVLSSFQGPCPSGMECCHGPKGQWNNEISNLRWGTHKSNMEDKKRDGTNQCGERSGTAKLTESDVNSIWSLWESGVFQKDIADKMGVSCTTIEQILTGKTWKHLARNRKRDKEGKTIRRTWAGRGEEGTGAKLTAEDVREIRNRFLDGGCSQSALAREYGISSTAIRYIIKRNTWKDV